MNALYACALTALLGLAGGWYVQGLRWGESEATLRKDQLESLQAAHDERDAKVKAAEDKKEVVEREFNDFKKAEADRDDAIGSGVKRVYVRASCPAVPAAETDTSRAASGTAELDPAYRQTLSDLRRGAAEQLRLLNLCRAELIAR